MANLSSKDQIRWGIALTITGAVLEIPYEYFSWDKPFRWPASVLGALIIGLLGYGFQLWAEGKGQSPKHVWWFLFWPLGMIVVSRLPNLRSNEAEGI